MLNDETHRPPMRPPTGVYRSRPIPMPHHVTWPNLSVSAFRKSLLENSLREAVEQTFKDLWGDGWLRAMKHFLARSKGKSAYMFERENTKVVALIREKYKELTGA